MNIWNIKCHQTPWTYISQIPDKTRMISAHEVFYFVTSHITNQITENASTNLHLPCNTINLSLLKPHSLCNTQRWCAAIWIAGKGFTCDMWIPKDKVHLYSSLIILQSQEALPHDWVTLQNKNHPHLTPVNSETQNLQLFTFNIEVVDEIWGFHNNENYNFGHRDYDSMQIGRG